MASAPLDPVLPWPVLLYPRPQQTQSITQIACVQQDTTTPQIILIHLEYHVHHAQPTVTVLAALRGLPAPRVPRQRLVRPLLTTACVLLER